MFTLQADDSQLLLLASFRVDSCSFGSIKTNQHSLFIYEVIFAIDQYTINIYLDINKEAILYSLA